MGNDLFDFCSDALIFYFNPRSRVGNDQSPGNRKESVLDFNPRSRVGNDVVMTYDDYAYGISIHVPAWGTTVTAIGVLTGQIFQSTFPRGERLSSQNY